MSLEKGVRQVTCRECGAEGEVRIGTTLARGRKVKVSENVPHLKTCSRYRRSQPRHLKKKGWRQQEKKMNQQLGARDTLASGAVGKDGDGRAFHRWRIEAKQTMTTKYRITQVVWEKLVKGALLAGEEPVLHVELARGSAKRVVLRKDLYDALESADIHTDGRFSNRLSYLVTYDQPRPLLIELDPPGVMLDEAHFLTLKDSVE